MTFEEWAFGEVERPRAKRKGQIISAVAYALREAMRDIPDDAHDPHIARCLAVAAYDAMEAEGVVSLNPLSKDGNDG